MPLASAPPSNPFAPPSTFPPAPQVIAPAPEIIAAAQVPQSAAPSAPTPAPVLAPPAPALHLVADNGPRRVGGRAPGSTPQTPLDVAQPALPTTMIPPVVPIAAPVAVPVAAAAAASAPPAPVFADVHDTAVLAPIQIVDGPAPAPSSTIDVMKREPSIPSASAGSLAALEAREISAWFGDRKVLDHVSLLMPAGECTALIGPSGCGKSTFLRILNRMHELIPSASLAGDVLLDGADLYARENRLTDARRQVGMVFQKPNPFPAMSIYDNVVAGLRLTGKRVSQGHKDGLVESCLTKAGLWKEVKDRLRQPGGALSGGQQQRLCIARSLAIQPRVLLMDEPCSALDPTSTRRIEQTIRELVTEVTIVIVTHNMQQAARVSDKCAFFLAEAGTPGVIVEHGETEAMFNAPSDPRTYDYVNGRFG
jgi:phosphate transport system ATP-binding protein